MQHGPRTCFSFLYLFKLAYYSPSPTFFIFCFALGPKQVPQMSEARLIGINGAYYCLCMCFSSFVLIQWCGLPRADVCILHTVSTYGYSDDTNASHPVQHALNAVCLLSRAASKHVQAKSTLLSAALVHSLCVVETKQKRIKRP